MNKANITLAIGEEQLSALEYSLKKEGTTVQKRMDEALRQLYEQSVPEAVREYLDSKTASPKRPARPNRPRPRPPESAPPTPAAAAEGMEERQ